MCIAFVKKVVKNFNEIKVLIFVHFYVPILFLISFGVYKDNNVGNERKVLLLYKGKKF